MALVTLQTIFQDAFPAYEHTHPLPAHVRKAAHAIMQCQTAALGGHIQACPDGHMSRIWYNSCRHRAWWYRTSGGGPSSKSSHTTLVHWQHA